MNLNLLPQRGPFVGVALEIAVAASLDTQITQAAQLGFAAIELPMTGELPHLHAPNVSAEGREDLKIRLQPFRRVVIDAPHQATFDVTLVSPSAAIRRASLSEIWSACRFARAVGAATVLIRPGAPPLGVRPMDRDRYLSECLTALDHTAGEQGVTIGVLNRDRFHRLRSLTDMDPLPLQHTGVALDIAHALDMGETLEDVTAFIAERAASLVHVRVPLSMSVGEAVAPVLLEAGYARMISLVPPAPDADIRAAGAWWQQAVSGKPDNMAEDDASDGESA
jgi:sugar phosphate isomerase/epimerase